MYAGIILVACQTSKGTSTSVSKRRRTSVRVHGARGPRAERAVLECGALGGLAVNVRLRGGLALRERRAPAECEHRV